MKNHYQKNKTIMNKFPWTSEQNAIIDCESNQQINAVAGSGKTSTLVGYAEARPEQKLLYLVFNKAMKTEANAKFRESGLTNITAETAHSLAFRDVMTSRKYQLNPTNYKLFDLLDYLEMRIDNEPVNTYTMILLSHIKKLHAIFCGSQFESIDDVHYVDYCFNEKSVKFVQSNFGLIYEKAQLFFDKQNSGEIPVNHDFYLKRYQLNKPDLSQYDAILFDEGQDASRVMLDIFLNQNCTKVIVGDEFQQIYGWRFSVNAFAELGFQPQTLSTSWRFGQTIADIAQRVINQRQRFGLSHDIQLSGGNSKKPTELVSKAFISRSNIGLLQLAVDYVAANSGEIHFIGGFANYTYANSASVYDVLNLFNNNIHLVRDFTLKQLGSFPALVEYVTETEDIELGLMVKLVERYGQRLPDILNLVKNRNTTEPKISTPHFGTTHKVKGFEFDTVTLDDTFIDRERLTELLIKPMSDRDRIATGEELNLLYVAITRAKYRLNIPSLVAPSGIEASDFISLI